jgi:ABC-type amino acid transport system permease subunit
MLALASANAVSVILFGTLYIVAGLDYLSQEAFLVCLALLFVLITALWVRVEARQRGLEPVQRLGRVAAGLVLVVIAVPIAVLMPVFSLDQQLPIDVGLHVQRGPIMALIFIALVLTLVVNVLGGIAIAVRAAVARARA